MNLWKGILCGVVGGFIGMGLVIGLGTIGALLILAVLLLAAGLYDLNQHYLKKGPRIIK